MYYGLIMPMVYTGGVYIRSVRQTAESAESGGVNEITVTLTNGRKEAFRVRNGEQGDVDSLTNEQMTELLAPLKINRL